MKKILFVSIVLLACVLIVMRISKASPQNVYTTTLVCSGTIALPTSAVSSGGKYGASSSTPLQTACTGMLTTDRATLTFNADPTSTTGYAPSASGGLEIIAYPDAGGGEIDLYLINDTANSITPSAATLNYQVTR